MKFGDNLKNLRKSKKLSQEDLAEKIQVSRQSVSKWETGDAYPSMNNILELCKIFHCHINDLVNDSILDIDSLDDEVKENVIKFKKEQQTKMKGLSKAISIIAKIGRITTLIGISVIIILMIALDFIASKIDVVDNKLKWDGKDTISIIEENNQISIKVNDKVVIDSIIINNEAIKLKAILENNSKFKVLGYMETLFVFSIIYLVLINIMLKKLENLFININKGDTPFTLENVGYIRKIAYIMILVTILPNIGGVIFELLLKTDLGIEFELFSLVEILFLFSIAYIFQYGYEIQLDSKGKMYGAESE